MITDLRMEFIIRFDRRSEVGSGRYFIYDYHYVPTVARLSAHVREMSPRSFLEQSLLRDDQEVEEQINIILNKNI